jgi:hypothetical protein
MRLIMIGMMMIMKGMIEMMDDDIDHDDLMKVTKKKNLIMMI